MTMGQADILTLVTGGAGDEARARRLTSGLNAAITIHGVDKSAPRLSSGRAVNALLASRPWDLVYLEGTGLAGGVPVIHAARSRGQRYVVSAGDPVGGFFANADGPLMGRLFESYERALYRSSSGFIGWTPYLTGMAIKMGAPRGVTVEGAVDLDAFRPYSQETRRAMKEQFGLDPGHLVCGVVGTLVWTARQAYCYGLELIEMLKRLRRTDVSVLIVGEGKGRQIMEERIPEHLRHRIVFTGRLPHAQVVDALNAMDIGFITQTLDLLGSGRLTTKLPEYLACGLPVAMSPTPGFYDYVVPAGWPLPPCHPASHEFHAACAQWIDGLTRDEVARTATHARASAERQFGYGHVAEKFTRFIQDVLSAPALRGGTSPVRNERASAAEAA